MHAGRISECSAGPGPPFAPRRASCPLNTQVTLSWLPCRVPERRLAGYGRIVSSSKDMGVRSSQLMGSLALATDLGTGQPLARALRTCVLGVAIGRALNVDEETVR